MFKCSATSGLTHWAGVWPAPAVSVGHFTGAGFRCAGHRSFPCATPIRALEGLFAGRNLQILDHEHAVRTVAAFQRLGKVPKLVKREFRLPRSSHRTICRVGNPFKCLTPNRELFRFGGPRLRRALVLSSD
jgi:hypothetical protein